jgi:hypothetical protein
MASKFYVKRRSIESYRNPYGSNIKYGPWIKIQTFDTLEAAHAHLTSASRVGLYDYAIIHKGRRLTSSNGALKVEVR